mmetsp:Transcript_17584/g.39668  ORF Transcript_17584/g.39668 Transcript_17584/m.39668 type:complete len:111 (+) Transcript_17584:63-395(+)
MLTSVSLTTGIETRAVAHSAVRTILIAAKGNASFSGMIAATPSPCPAAWNGIYEQVFAFFPFFLTISRLRKHSAIHADESSLEHYSQVAHLHTTSEDDFVVVWFGAIGRS